MTSIRTVQQIIPSHPTSDGDGVKIQRVAGFDNALFSPFLMVDEIKSDDTKDYVGGFPPHPHRGIETLTYMKNGHFQHRDHMGNVGQLRSGGAQWMAAGRGVIHSEMPQMDKGSLHGFQIWINQPARDKMKRAQYTDFQSDTIHELNSETSGLFRTIAGSININGEEVAGPLDKTGVPLVVADWQSEENQKISLTNNDSHNMMVYVYQGSINIGGQQIHTGELAILSRGSVVNLVSLEKSGALIFSGEPIHEPIVHYGPFVMNSMEEIEQTIQDYNSGLFETY